VRSWRFATTRLVHFLLPASFWSDLHPFSCSDRPLRASARGSFTSPTSLR
jgi:hypothetical protein